MKRLFPFFLLLLPLSPASAYTAYKTVSFGPTQTAQTVTYTVVNSANTTVSAGVSGAVIELGGGAYASAITVPDGANYFVVWSETNSGTTYTASDKIDAQATAALATLANQTSILTTTTGTNTIATGIKAKTDLVATNAMDSPNEITSQGQAGTTSTAVAALPAANATAVWGAAVKTITGGTVTTVTNPVALPTTAPTGYGGSSSGADTPGTTSLLSRLGTPAGATLAADVAAVKADTAGLTTSVAALPAATVAAIFGSSFITIPGSHTTTGTGEVLTYKQVQSLSDAVLGGDNTSTVPAASGTATVTYYLRGQPKVAGNVVAVSTVTYDASKNQIGRVVLVSQPYPAIP